MTYAPAKFEVATSNRLDRDAFTRIYSMASRSLEILHYLIFDHDLGVKVTQNVAHYPLHHVTYRAAKFEAATSNGLGGDAFTKKNNI